MEDREYILRRTMSAEFQTMRENSMFVSHFKYGWPEDTYARKISPASALANLEKRLEAYKETGNKDYLMDIANFADLEFQYPSISSAHLNRNNEGEQPKFIGVTGKEIESWKDPNDWGDTD